MMLKRLVPFLLLLLVLSGCFPQKGEILVISREDGSGTRTAFVDLFEAVSKGDGTRKDLTTKEAVIAKQTDVAILNVAQSEFAIGYISMDSLNESVKAIAVDGVFPSQETISSGEYPVTRPFLVVYLDSVSALTQNFLDFLMDVPTPTQEKGKIVISGSSSVTPFMEKAREAYLELNQQVTIEIQQNDSSSGIRAAIDGTCDIGMSSRELKEEETAILNVSQIANDAIAIIVNPKNPLDSLSRDEIRRIFTGQITSWSEVHG